ncbi:scp-like extracellular protein [Niveomyces insectorum RCEF 264]|uniref:Scp-like extracellular protein n=1 Tax=Niveomyces insectorum RCEF 264 TaxID=1081102 RepID=A0A167T564_9HYPO|nr:scp-like extracellular protein [Niveomyces insectorum RCEF 264]
MKSSLALVLASSLLAAAGPIKRAVFTNTVTDLVYVTVTVSPSSTKATVVATTPTTTAAAKPTTPNAAVETLTRTVTPTPAPAAPTQAPAPAPPAPAPAAPAAPAAQVAHGPAAAPAPPAAQASAPSDYAGAAVNQHNLHRTNHSAAAVSWNSDLASYAATTASSCVFAHDLTPGQSTGPYGQNIAVYGASGNAAGLDTSKIVGNAISNEWYNSELLQYPLSNYGSSSPDTSNFEHWGHFSQIVWAATSEIGCASQFCAAGTIYSSLDSWFTVCNYRAQGNIAGQYGQNVFPPLGQASVSVSI